MALNWTMLSTERTPVPLPNEMTLQDIPGAEITLTIPRGLPSSNATAGGSGGSKTLKETGGLWLTDQRLIFVARQSSASSSSFQSLSIPLLSILSTSFQQPYFGANFLSVDINPSPDGGLTHGTKAEIRVQDRGLFSFASALDKTRERAIYMKRQAASEEDALPIYEAPEGPPPPSASAAGPSGPRDVPNENPPGYDA